MGAGKTGWACPGAGWGAARGSGPEKVWLLEHKRGVVRTGCGSPKADPSECEVAGSTGRQEKQPQRPRGAGVLSPSGGQGLVNDWVQAGPPAPA